MKLSRKTTQLFKRAIVRIPAPNFAHGLTTSNLGAPSYNSALLQHSQYCKALEECGLTITTLDADLRFPDSTFVEDTAVLTPHSAILTRPGAPSREGEVAIMREALSEFFPVILEIEPPGTVDGGDICEAQDHFFLGLSQRTNEEGVRQLSAYLTREGYNCSVIDIRQMTGVLHLKSAISYIGDNTMVVAPEMEATGLFRDYELIRVPSQESYGANCIRVNERVLVAAGHPHLTAEFMDRGFDPVVLDMSEFQKMDGGLSCLSLRF